MYICWGTVYPTPLQRWQAEFWGKTREKNTLKINTMRFPATRTITVESTPPVPSWFRFDIVQQIHAIVLQLLFDVTA